MKIKILKNIKYGKVAYVIGDVVEVALADVEEFKGKGIIPIDINIPVNKVAGIETEGEGKGLTKAEIVDRLKEIGADFKEQDSKKNLLAILEGEQDNDD